LHFRHYKKYTFFDEKRAYLTLAVVPKNYQILVFLEKWQIKKSYQI